MNGLITVIIPTTLAPQRREHVHRAIDSIVAQPDVDAEILIVANGSGIEDRAVADVARRPRVTVVRVAQASLPLALRVGREQVRTPFFAILDDDDEFLPDGLPLLLQGFRCEPAVHAVVGNAILRREGCEDRRNTTDVSFVRSDPLRALVRDNWLVPGAALFRSEAIPEATFAGIIKYLEWTYLAAVLSLRHTLAFLSEAVVVHYIGQPLSLDQSAEALFGRIQGLQQVLSLPLPSDVKHAFQRKVGAQFHVCSDACLQQGDLVSAVRYHLHSLLRPGGWRYVSYTGPLVHALTVPRAKRGLKPQH